MTFLIHLTLCKSLCSRMWQIASNIWIWWIIMCWACISINVNLIKIDTKRILWSVVYHSLINSTYSTMNKSNKSIARTHKGASLEGRPKEKNILYLSFKHQRCPFVWTFYILGEVAPRKVDNTATGNRNHGMTYHNHWTLKTHFNSMNFASG